MVLDVDNACISDRKVASSHIECHFCISIYAGWSMRDLKFIQSREHRERRARGIEWEAGHYIVSAFLALITMPKERRDTNDGIYRKRCCAV